LAVIAGGALVAWYRFITSVRQALRHQFRVVAVQAEAPDVASGGPTVEGLASGVT
jgi:hypothetical protein